MKKEHNKKRNTGLMYEFLVHYISSRLIEGDTKGSTAALKIIKNYFKPKSELYKEFRLINSLIKTKVTNESVAMSILGEAKIAARDYNLKKLNREKSLLIRAVNHKLNYNNFYDQQISEYRDYATIQRLLDGWRNPNQDLMQQANFEDQLVKRLTTKKEEKKQSFVMEESAGKTRLLMKIMMNKLNDKYASSLNDKQKDLIRAYAWSSASNSSDVVKCKMQETRKYLIESIDDYIDNHSDGEYVNKQLSSVKNEIMNESLDKIDDQHLVRFMLYLKLQDELVSK